MIRAAAAIAMTVSACTTQNPQPEMRTYGVTLPLCVLLCRGTVETVDADGEGSTISGGDITEVRDGPAGGV